MITLSGAQTLAELPKFTATSSPNDRTAADNRRSRHCGGTMPGSTMPGGTMPGSTMPRPRIGPTGTTIGSDEATVMERNLATPTRSGSDDATVMERFGSAGAAAPTAIEAKMKFGDGAQGESTVLDGSTSRAHRNATSE